MQVIDVNTLFGTTPSQHEDLSASLLARQMEGHGISAALTMSLKGVQYVHREGNRETLAASQACSRLLPVATFNPQDSLGWQQEVEWCLQEGFVAFRFFPGQGFQSWSVHDLSFQRILSHLGGRGVPVILPADGSASIREVAQVTADFNVPVILAAVGYSRAAEAAAVMPHHPHLHAETSWLSHVGAIEVMAAEVGADRLLFGSAAPQRPVQGMINRIFQAEISDAEKTAIFSGNALRLLNLAPQRLSSTAVEARARAYPGPIIDVHGHLGFWRFPIRGGTVQSLEALLAKHNIETLLLSSALGITHDMAEGNRHVHQAIAGHPRLRGYVVVNGHDLEGSVREMDTYYRQDHFLGAKIHCEYSQLPTGSPAIRGLMAEIGKRGRPVKIHNFGPNWLGSIIEVAKAHPHLPIIIAHGGGKGTGPAIRDVPNLYLEFCSSRPIRGLLNEALQSVGPERLLFGSDQDLLDPGFMLGVYEDAGFSAEENRLILYENAKRLFGL